MRVLFIQSFYLVLFPLCVFSKQMSSPSDTIPMNPNVRYGVLENGLVYYILKNSRPEKTIELALIVKAGYPHEEADELGVAHLLEHLGFRSTVNFPNGLKEFLMGRGFKAGTHFSASTNNTTNYDLTIQSGDSVLLDYSLLALHDFANGRLFVHGEIEEERAAVINEFAKANTRSFLSLLESKYLLLDLHPLYAPHLSKEMKNIKTVPTESLVGFYRKWYRPEQQAVIIVGDIDEIEVEKKVKVIFSALRNETGSTESPKDMHQQYDVPLTGKNKMVVVNQGLESTKVSINVVKKRKSCTNISGPVTIAEYKMKVMDELYNALMKNRLETVARESNLKLSGFVHALNRRAIHSLAGIDAITTQFNVKELTEAKAAIQFAMTELHRTERFGFTGNEFLRAKEVVKNEQSRQFDKPTSQSLKLSLIRHFISYSAVPANELELSNSLLDEISLVEINEMAKDWLSDKGNTDVVLTISNENDPKLPSEVEVFSWIRETQNIKITPYTERKVKPLPKLPKREHSHDYTITEEKEAGIVNLVLHSGIQVILKRLGPQSECGQSWNEVALHGFSPGGISLYRGEDRSTASIAASVGAYSGLGSLSNSELATWKKDKNRRGYLSAAPYIKELEEGVIGAASLNNYEELLQLIYLYFVEPREDLNAFNDWVNARRKTYVAGKNAQARLEDSIHSVLDGNSSTVTEMPLTTVRLDKAFRVYKERFANPCDFTFVIAGFFEIDDLIEKTVRYLGALPPCTLRKEVAKEMLPSFYTKNDLRVVMVGDSTGNVHIRMLFLGSQTLKTADYLKLEILNESIQALLFSRLRESEKGVYGVTSTLKATKQGRYSFDVAFEAVPADTDRLIAAVVEEISNLSKNGIGETIFNYSTAIVREKIIMEGKNTSYWVDYLVDHFRKGELPTGNSERTEILNKITISDIKEAAGNFLDGKHYMLFMLL